MSEGPPKSIVASRLAHRPSPETSQPAAARPASRRLLAVLAADVAGYTRLMEQAEELTHQRLMHILRTIVVAGVDHHDGQIVKNTGDGFLATFPSVIAATRCALEILEAVRASNADLPASDAILFRMGLNLADVIVELHDVFGEGVNLAARLQSYAEPGGLIVSGSVAEAIGGQVPATITSLGEFYPKNLTRAVHAFAVRAHGMPTFAPAGPPRQSLECPSIAVLPFRSIGGGPDEAHFAEGIIEGIIHLLSGLDGLLVISHGSTHAYAGTQPNVRDVGRELDVRYVLSRNGAPRRR